MKLSGDAAGSDGVSSRTTRRDLLKAGAGLAAAVSVPAVAAPAVAQTAINLPRAPNIIVLMTDQERHHMHWPKGWAEANLPGLQRLKRHGLYFNRAYTAVTLAGPCADPDWAVRAGEPRYPDFAMAGSGAPGPPAEHRLAAQGESGVRGRLEGQVAFELGR